MLPANAKHKQVIRPKGKISFLLKISPFNFSYFKLHLEIAHSYISNDINTPAVAILKRIQQGNYLAISKIDVL